MISRFTLAAAIAAVAFGLVGAASAAKPAPQWTVAKAKRALLDARRIVARDDLSRLYRFTYYFDVIKVEKVRPVGKSFAVSTQIGLLQDLPDEWYGGVFTDPPRRAWFCLRPQRATWRLTGFDVLLPFLGGTKVPNAVCSPAPKRMAHSGRPLG